MKTVRDVEKALIDAGFSKLRQNGSHQTYGHPDGRRIMVPDPKVAVDSRRNMANLRRDARRVLSGQRILRGGMAAT